MNDWWAVRPGTFEVRASCPKHPHAPMRACGEIARCSECGDAVLFCGALCGWKACVREKGHEGMHASPSGSAWPPKTGPASPPPAATASAEPKSSAVPWKHEAARLEAEVAALRAERDEARRDLSALAKVAGSALVIATFDAATESPAEEPTHALTQMAWESAQASAALRAEVARLTAERDAARRVIGRALSWHGREGHTSMCGLLAGKACNCWMGAARALASVERGAKP